MQLHKLPGGIYNMSQTREFQATEEKNGRVLLVEDNYSLLEVVYQILQGQNYQVTRAESGEEAIEALFKEDFDLVITDLNMGTVSGIEVLRKTKELNPETMVIIMTANHDMEYYGEALELDACDYLLKPFELNDFLDRVSHCLRKHEGRQAGKKRRTTYKEPRNDHNVSL